MREILFRGKTAEGDWTYGYYVHTPKRTGAFGQIMSQADIDRHHILTMKCNIIKEIYPETVGQYTNKKDINGIKIFEYDIVKEGCNGRIGVVVWDDDLATYKLDGFGEGYTIQDAECEWEIIGNKFDDPELLKGE